MHGETPLSVENCVSHRGGRNGAGSKTERTPQAPPKHRRKRLGTAQVTYRCSSRGRSWDQAFGCKKETKTKKTRGACVVAIHPFGENGENVLLEDVDSTVAGANGSVPILAGLPWQTIHAFPKRALPCVRLGAGFVPAKPLKVWLRRIRLRLLVRKEAWRWRGVCVFPVWRKIPQPERE